MLHQKRIRLLWSSTERCETRPDVVPLWTGTNLGSECGHLSSGRGECKVCVCVYADDVFYRWELRFLFLFLGAKWGRNRKVRSDECCVSHAIVGIVL